VARGDLGADVPFEELPLIQEEIVARCRDAGKPVIIATHMLESMREHPVPTRAEVTDTAFAVMIGSDATMLSGETATGKHPLIALDAMARIHLATESHMARLNKGESIRLQNSQEDKAEKAIDFAQSKNAEAFIVITMTGKSAQQLSKFRSQLPIIAVSNDDTVLRKLCLSYGVLNLLSQEDAPESIIAAALQEGLITKGQRIVLVTDGFHELSVLTA